MKITRVLLMLAFASFLFFTVSTHADTLPRSVRTTYNFNSGWKLLVGDAPGAESAAFDDGAWKSVTLPHAWNEDAAFKVSIHDLPVGIAWYRKHFTLPTGSKGRKCFLEFEGIRQGGDFYLNGKLIGRHENGVMAFGFDVTDAVKAAPQENVLAARIDNSWNYHEQSTGQAYQWSDRNFYANYGGINKNVFLHITDRLHQTLPLYSNLGTSGVYVYAQDFNIPGRSAKITAEAEVKNEYGVPKTFGYRAIVADMDGNNIQTLDGGLQTLAPGETKTVSASAVVHGLHFWSWGYGYLYTVSTILTVDGQVADVVQTRTGFRKTDFSHGMFSLNDRALQIKGYAQRTTNEWPAVGLSVPAWLSDFSNRMIVEGNGNLVRWMHVTPWKQDVESLDRLGLMESVPAGDAEKDVDGNRWAQRLALMRDAIIYNRNNPSVVFYESGNNDVSEEHMAQMKALRDTWDPHGGRASGSRNMLNSKAAEYGGEMLYINKSRTMPLWAMEYSRDEALRKWQDELTPPFHKDGATITGDKNGPAYNRNQDTFAIEDVARWYDYWHERPGTGERVNAGGVNIVFSDSNTHYRGDQNYRRSGEVDAMRIPKDAYFVHQVMWDGWVNVEQPRIYIIGHWNYAPGTVKDISVVSGAEKVRVFVNGKPQGDGVRSSQFLFTFKNVRWQPGTLKAVGYDANGKVACSTQKTTAGSPVGIRLTAHTGPGGLQANGADMAMVDVEVVDAAGQRCPTALNKVHFVLSGPAEWRGGIAQDDNRPDNYILSSDLPVECGVNRVLMRSLPQAGTIVLTATGVGLKSASVTLASHAVSVTGGLSAGMPDAGLPSYLERGPTPLGPSFTMTRVPIQIAGATAGANAEQSNRSFDDDETTGWTNDGKRSTGWIEYQFARPSRVSEVTLKMGGWRKQSYPIRILLGKQVVFAGETPRSLGYVTLSLKPTTGKSLRVELTGNASTSDAYGNIVEVGGAAPAPAAVTQGNAKGMLNIVEAEIYGPLNSSP